MSIEKNYQIQIDSLAEFLNTIQEPRLVIEKNTGLIVLSNSVANDLFKIEVEKPCYVNSLIPNLKYDSITGDETHYIGQTGTAFKLSVIKISSELLILRMQSNELGEKALHSQRLQTLGMLAGAIAHDFNNVLAGMLGHTSYLRSLLPKEGKHVESLIAIEDGGKNASHLIQEILNFSRLDISQKPSLVNLTAVVSSTCKLLRGALVPKFGFEYVIPEKEIYIDAVEGKIAQVIVNLVVNARNASDAGSKIKLELSTVANLIQESADYAAVRNFACLKITDTGKGIPPELLDKIFEPYFTTNSQGTGLGLKIVDSLVSGFGGTIRIESELAQGTSVYVYLPLTAQDESKVQSQKNAKENESQKLLSGKEKILVVDDEEGVRNVIKLSLEHFGYDVQIAENAKVAIKLFREPNNNFNLVILDMLMPEISGKDLFLALREMQADIKILLVSGYVSEKVVKGLLKQGNCAFLPKPFTVEELAQSIRMLFD